MQWTETLSIKRKKEWVGEIGARRLSRESRKMERNMRKQDTPSGMFYYFIAMEPYTNMYCYIELTFKACHLVE